MWAGRDVTAETDQTLLVVVLREKSFDEIAFSEVPPVLVTVPVPVPVPMPEVLVKGLAPTRAEASPLASVPPAPAPGPATAADPAPEPAVIGFVAIIIGGGPFAATPPMPAAVAVVEGIGTPALPVPGAGAAMDA